MSFIGVRELDQALREISLGLSEAAEYLSGLDGQIGDGDHGTTMASGFQAIVGQLPSLSSDESNPSELFSLCAHTFIDAVGATVGPLYATAFEQAASFCKGRDKIALRDIALVLVAMKAGIQKRGGAQAGDKTMLDVWGAVEQFAEKAHKSGQPTKDMLLELSQIAQSVATSTKSMLASKGRAARLGERSIGHIDPGAASAAIIIERLIHSLISGRNA